MTSFFSIISSRQYLRLLGVIFLASLFSHCTYKKYPSIQFNDAPAFYDKTSEPPTIQASSAFLVHYPSMSIVYQKNAEQKRPIASLQKLLTALIVDNHDRLQQKTTLKKEDFKDYDPQSIKLKPHESYTREQVMKMLLISSNNIAANTLARVHSGSTRAFVKEMNRLALELGMINSNFKNPHGLTTTNQYSTAIDATKMAIYAYKKPFIASLCSQPESLLYDKKQQTLYNTNALVKQVSITKDYRCVGLKTGYTKASGYCLSLVITNDKETFFLTILNSTRSQIYNDARKLFKHVVNASYFHYPLTTSTTHSFIN